MKTSQSTVVPVAAALLSAMMFAVVSCSSQSGPKPGETIVVQTQPSPGETAKLTYVGGVAGGTIEDTFTASAKIAAVDAASRTITLLTDDGTQAVFEAPAEMRNFDQLHVGDTATATIEERLEISVNPNGLGPGVSQAAYVSRTPKGAKPGAIVGQSFQLDGTIAAIDTTTRVAAIQFPNGQTRVVNVRPDVDLSKYKVGDTVSIKITEQLKVLVAGS